MSFVRLSTAVAAFAVLSLHAARGDEPTTATLREKILRADDSGKAAATYKAYFLRLGRAALRDQMKDEDTGIALQAAWESHLKPMKRPKPIDGRTDDVYDPAELAKFLTFLKDRTKAPVPDWWAKTIVDMDLFLDRHHGVLGRFLAGPGPRPAAADAPPEPVVREKWGIIGYSAGGRSIAFPKATFDNFFTTGWVGVLGDKRSAVAGYSLSGGASFRVAGFAGPGGKPDWTTKVWGAGRRMGGVGYHWVEMREQGGVLYLFGAESHGAFVEAFDMTTGKCRFRFCSCYWFHWSEAWGLK